MNKFAKLIDNRLEYAPVNYTLEDGRIIVGFNKSETLMRRYGFKEVIDIEPVYDPTIEYLTVTQYIETDLEIRPVYTINKFDTGTEEVPIETKVSKLETKTASLEEELAMTQSMVNDLIINTVDGGIK